MTKAFAADVHGFIAARGLELVHTAASSSALAGYVVAGRTRSG